MSILIQALLEAILAYAISLAASDRSSVINTARERKLAEVLEAGEDLQKALRSTGSFRSELRDACTELVRARNELGSTKLEIPLRNLLVDEVFQDDLMEWLMAGGIVEGDRVKERLLEKLESVLIDNGANTEQISHFKVDYFQSLDKAIYSNSVLADWRHRLSLDYLRAQVAELRVFAEESAGIYSEARRSSALARYCEIALKAWDIIDLSNLPEGDIHIATQAVLLRQLYVPLKVTVEARKDVELLDQALVDIETRRDQRRLKEAGYILHIPGMPDGKEVPRYSVGERLASTHRLVVLGDPGGGKTTMLRWFATALLIRKSNDPAFKQLPDTKSLPSNRWIPVLLRCRDISETDLNRSFTDFLTEHLKKSALLPDEAKVNAVKGFSNNWKQAIYERTSEMEILGHFL